MVRVIAVSNPRLAQAFVDYMATQGIELSVHNTGEAAEIWLADDSHLDQVQHELQQFLVDPLNRRYQAASWETGNTGADLHYPGYSYLQTLRSKAGPLTLGVMVLCIAVYILMQAMGDDTVMYWLSWPQDSSQYPQLWRWVSHAFLHFSLLHIALTCCGGGISAARWKNASAPASCSCWRWYQPSSAVGRSHCSAARCSAACPAWSMR